MVFESFAALVGVLALAYAAVTKFIQNKLIDKSEMEAMQAESKRLNEEFKKAQKANDRKRMDRIMQEQMDFLPRMNTVMFKQFRPMFALIIVFAAFMWVVGTLDPSTKDDIRMSLTDDGAGCDAAAMDGIFTGCLKLSDANYGKWTVAAKALEGGTEVADNETYFIYGQAQDTDTYVEAGKGEWMGLSTDKREYHANETVVITAIPANMTKGASFIIPIAPPRMLSVDRVEATISNGTYFRVDLPLEIPIFNVKTIYQPYWWFILVSLIANLGIGFVTGQMKKMGKKEQGGVEKK
ncbi:EMC3/TMCO1 family protein [Candidatus Micrarchaeota archaeon]|nr:EMC3/TMCO1 family protein [Candidatus Micrarchaeota archaeon]